MVAAIFNGHNDWWQSLTLRGVLDRWQSSPANSRSPFNSPPSQPAHPLSRPLPRPAQALVSSSVPEQYSSHSPSDFVPCIPSDSTAAAPRSPQSPPRPRPPTPSGSKLLPDTPSIEITAVDQSLAHQLSPASPTSPDIPPSPSQKASPSQTSPSQPSPLNLDNQALPLSEKAKGKQKAIETLGQAEGNDSENNQQRSETTTSSTSRRQHWFTFRNLKETNGKVLNGVKVRQLPQPRTQKERQDQALEWSTREAQSDAEIKKLYRKIEHVNHELLFDHHELPSYEAFKVLFPRLPNWYRLAQRPKWRSPFDERLLAEQALDPYNTKLFRYIYHWYFDLPLEETAAFLEVLMEESWLKVADEYGCWFSFSVMRKNAKAAIEEAGKTGGKNVQTLNYTGVGASSEFQVNAACRSFHHLERPRSLFGVAIDIVRKYQAKYPTSKSSYVQSFLTSLPLSTFPYSSHLFMHAETLFAVSKLSSTVRGSANLLSCGNVDLQESFDKYLQHFKNDSDSIQVLIGKGSVSTSVILYDYARRRGYTTIGQLKVGVQKRFCREELGGGKEEEDQGPITETEQAAIERRKRIRDQEAALRAKETVFGTPPISVKTRSSRPFPRPVVSSSTSSSSSSSSSRKPSKPQPPTGPRLASQRDPQLAKTRRDYKIDTLNSIQLRTLLQNTLTYPTGPILSALEPYSARLDLERNIVTELIFRITTGRGSHSRNFDNFFDLASLSSKKGVKFKTTASLKKGAISNNFSLTGVGIDARSEEVVLVNYNVVAQVILGELNLRLRWRAKDKVLQILHLDGVPVQVFVRGGARGGHLRNVEWNEAKLVKTPKLDAFVQILGLH